MQGMVLKPSIALFAIGAAALALGCDTSPTARVSMPDSPLLLLSASTSIDVGAEAKKTDGLTDVAEPTAHANLHSMNQSGVKARIDFVDDGTTLFVTGAATGLDPAQTYLTLIYDNGALPGGPNACRPTIFDPGDPEFLLNRMVVGSWAVDANGNGTLSAVNTNFGVDYVPIGLFRAASIRRVLGPPPAPGAPPPTELEACGRVAIEEEDDDEDDAVPFKGQADGAVVSAIPEPDGLHVTIVATGKATQLGQFTREERVIVGADGTFSGTLFFVAANGLQLTADIEGAFTSPTTAEGSFRFTGGTGRFGNASGEARFVDVIAPDGVGVASTFEGTIRFDGENGDDSGDEEEE